MSSRTDSDRLPNITSTRHADTREGQIHLFLQLFSNWKRRRTIESGISIQFEGFVGNVRDLRHLGDQDSMK